MINLIKVATVVMDVNEEPRSYKYGMKLRTLFDDCFIPHEEVINDGETAFYVAEHHIPGFVKACTKLKY